MKSKVFLILAALLLPISPISAQIFASNGQNPSQSWEKDNKGESTLVEVWQDDDLVTLTRQNGKASPVIERIHHSNSGNGDLAYFNGLIVSTRLQHGETGKVEFHVFQKQLGSEWKELPHDPSSTNASPFLLHPTSEKGLYLGSNFAMPGFFGSEKGDGSYYSWWRVKEDGRLAFSEIIRLEYFGKPVFERVPNEHWVRMRAEQSGLGRFLDKPLRVGNRFVFLTTSGAFWIIEDGKSSAKEGAIYSLEENVVRNDLSRWYSGPCPYDAPGGRWKHVVLGAQPTPEGKVLIAAREEGLIKDGPKILLHGAIPKYDETKEGFTGNGAATEGAFCVRFWPKVVWHELDPNTGKVEKVNPADAVEELKSLAELDAFSFKFRADGSLICGRQQPPQDENHGTDNKPKQPTPGVTPTPAKEKPTAAQAGEK